MNRLCPECGRFVENPDAERCPRCDAALDDD
jgi:rubrerythrin